MPTQVVMPQLGEAVVEGTVTRWLRARGERVNEFEPLLEVNTDKVDTEIPSPAAGVLLDILVSEGTTVNAGTILALIGEESEKKSNGSLFQGAPMTKVKSPEQPEALPVLGPLPSEIVEPAAPEHSHSLGFISPVVAKIAREKNIDLKQVTGTGQNNRITKRDVLEYLERHREKGPVEAEPAQAIPGAIPGQVAAAYTAVPMATRSAERPGPTNSIETLTGEIQPLTSLRRAIADHMVASKRTSPHVTTVMEVDLKQVVVHREAHKSAFSRDGINLTYTAYFVAATATALKDFPVVNSSWHEAGIQLHHEVNIGLATSLGEAGLIVPVVKNADGLSLSGLARAINDLATRARARQLKPDEVKGGTFTITNHGISGSLFATPIINQPQCGILGVGAIQKRVVVIDDAIAIRPMAYLTLTFDHRILDGAVADYFLGKVVELLQNWR